MQGSALRDSETISISDSEGRNGRKRIFLVHRRKED